MGVSPFGPEVDRAGVEIGPAFEPDLDHGHQRICQREAEDAEQRAHDQLGAEDQRGARSTVFFATIGTMMLPSTVWTTT